MVGDVDHPGARAMVVAAEEILLRPHAHVGGGHGDVGVVREVVGPVGNHGFPTAGGRDVPGRGLLLGNALPGTGRVIDTVVVSLRQRVGAHRAPRMVCHIGDVGREKALVVLVDPGGHVRPPEECLDGSRPVVGAHLQFHHRTPRMEADTVHSLYPLHRVMIGAPDGHRTVPVALDFRVDRHEGRRAVVLRPVELHPAGDPGSGEAHEGRLDHFLAVKEVVAVGLVPRGMDSPPDLREDHDLHELVLEEDGPP